MTKVWTCYTQNLLIFQLGVEKVNFSCQEKVEILLGGRKKLSQL